jgi:hypothetical protein
LGGTVLQYAHSARQHCLSLLAAAGACAVVIARKKPQTQHWARMHNILLRVRSLVALQLRERLQSAGLELARRTSAALRSDGTPQDFVSLGYTTEAHLDCLCTRCQSVSSDDGDKAIASAKLRYALAGRSRGVAMALALNAAQGSMTSLLIIAHKPELQPYNGNICGLLRHKWQRGLEHSRAWLSPPRFSGLVV